MINDHLISFKVLVGSTWITPQRTKDTLLLSHYQVLQNTLRRPLIRIWRVKAVLDGSLDLYSVGKEVLMFWLNGDITILENPSDRESLELNMVWMQPLPLFFFHTSITIVTKAGISLSTPWEQVTLIQHCKSPGLIATFRSVGVHI